MSRSKVKAKALKKEAIKTYIQYHRDLPLYFISQYELKKTTHLPKMLFKHTT